ncbi:hypothetical protein [Aquimarina sp. AU119]|uniref:hypothetical protein n=1 Tax=Aquimarina sp. AU119 TaxID=2108528 RepID=UPI000D68FF47|nr:hypothetical protein [Aquimarina sp. AU119]
MNKRNQLERHLKSKEHLQLKKNNNSHIIIWVDATGREYGRGQGMSAIEAINDLYTNYYSNFLLETYKYNLNI